VQQLCGLVGWVLVVTMLIARFGAMTAPLLLVLLADVAVGVLIARADATAPPLRTAQPSWLPAR
jgi:hypothetical protein